MEHEVRMLAVVEMDRLGLLRTGTALTLGTPIDVVVNDLMTALTLDSENKDTYVAALRILRIVDLAERGLVLVALN